MDTAKKRMMYTIAATMIVVFSATFAILMTLERTDYRNYLQAEYSKNMYELIDSVRSIRVNLSKAPIVGSKEQNVIVFDEIFRHASVANDKLHSLPVNQSTIQDTSKFLSQVGDFCYTLGKTTLEGKQLNESDYKTINDLKNRSYSLEDSLNKISEDINDGEIKWGEIRKKVTGVLAKEDTSNLKTKFEGIQKQIVQYPSLIYDGPFSDNNMKIKPRINSQKVISQNQAKDIIKKVVGENNIGSINLNERVSNSKIPAYSFDVLLKGKENEKRKIVCDISKHGGRVLYLIDNKTINDKKINRKEAIKKGNEYLERLGYKDMVPTYAMHYGNAAVISYVHRTNNVNIYPEQIKLKVALDNGNIIGVESEKYLTSYVDKRNISKPSITLEDARSKVGKKLNIKSEKLAIIPTVNNKEVLCYEFLGNYNGEKFIVYINADTGAEQRIIQIIDTPNGELTI